VLDRHTLIIPTRNRQVLLRRLVRHFHGLPSGAKLLVLDSSDPEIASANAAAMSFYGSALRHVIYPATTSPAVKFAQGLTLVDTPYVSFCGDDDLVFVDALRMAVEFLEAHPDYACAHGLYINFREDGNDLHVMREYAGPSIEANAWGGRVFRLLQKYESLFYAVFRTADLGQISAAMQAMPSLLFQELFQSVAALIKGKVKRLPVVYAARQTNPPVDSKRDRWQTYYWFAEQPRELIEHYRSYCDELWRFYEAHSAPRVEKDAFFKVLDVCHSVYFAAACPPEYFYSALKKYWPEDPYEDVASVDLFNESHSFRMPGIERHGRALRIMQYAIDAVYSAPHIALLNLRSRMTTGRPWKCRLPYSQRRLAAVGAFRSGYLQLCRYMSAQ